MNIQSNETLCNDICKTGNKPETENKKTIKNTEKI